MTQQVTHKAVFPPQIAPYIDVAAYIIDARAPASTLYLDRLLLGKELLILNRADQADPRETRRWLAFFKEAGYRCIAVDSASGQGMDQVLDFLALLLRSKAAMAQRRGINSVTLRVVALGVPNVGKSTFLNRMIGRKRFKTGNKPGITRGPQWVRVFEDVEMLDTAGVLRNPVAINRRKPLWMLLNLMPYDFQLREQTLTQLIQRMPDRAWAKLCRYYRLPEELHDARQAPEPDEAELAALEEPGTEGRGERVDAANIKEELPEGDWPENLVDEEAAEAEHSEGVEAEGDSAELVAEEDEEAPGARDPHDELDYEPPLRPDWLTLLGYVAARQHYRIGSDDSVDRAARRLITDFREGRFGRISLERAGKALITSPWFGRKE